MKIFFILILSSLISCNGGEEKVSKPEIKPKEKIQESSNGWSDEQGRIIWTEAMQKCESLSMRLPTAKEIDSAHKSGLTKQWRYGVYWTSEEKPKDSSRALIYNFDFGSSYDTKKSDVWDVRCYKK